MLKVIHRYKKSVYILILVCGIVLAMTGFGVSFRSMQSSNHEQRFAIRVDDEGTSFEDFRRHKRAVVEQYRKMLGKNFPNFEQTFLPRLSQELVDQTIKTTLLEREAKAFRLHVPDAEIARTLQSKFEGGYDPRAYKAFLQQSGMSAQEFEGHIASDLLTEQFTNIVEDLSVPSTKEVKSLVQRDLTTYDAKYIEVTSKDFEASVPTPEDAVLDKYYSEHSAEYELPERISYGYVVFDPADFRASVEVQADDIEMYYAEHESSFQTPETINVRHIQFNTPKNATPQQIADLKKKVGDVHEKLVAGESFESLALKFSDDVATKTIGGSLGWVEKSKLDKPLADAAFALKGPGVTEAITTKYGFDIAKVDEYKPSAPKKLDDVRSEIEAAIKAQEAPAYASTKAEEFLDLVQKSKGPLKAMAEEKKFTYLETPTLLTKIQDPAPAVAGLSAKAIESPDDKLKVVELGERSVIVQVLDFKEPEVPGLAAVKDKVIAAYKTEEAKKVAKDAVTKLAADYADGKVTAMNNLGSDHKAEIKEAKGISRQKPGSVPFTAKDVQNAVFAAKSGGRKLAAPFTVQDKLYVIEVTAVNPPENTEIDKKIGEYTSKASQEVASNFIDSYVGGLKSKAHIDVDPSILGES